MNEPSPGQCVEAVVHPTDEQRAAIRKWLAAVGRNRELGTAHAGEGAPGCSQSGSGQAGAKSGADEAENAAGAGGGACVLRGGQRCPFCIFSRVGFCLVSRLFPGLAAGAAGPQLEAEATGQAEAWGRALVEAIGQGMKETLEKIYAKIAALAQDHYELQREISELRQLEAKGWLNFALRVDAEDFRAFAVIMALGSRNAAAELLKVPVRSFYNQVERWAGRGAEYRRMLRLVEWRKKVGRKTLVPLARSVQSGEPSDEAENPTTVERVVERIATADRRDYPAILREVFEVLARQNATNWAAVRQEVMDIIRAEI